MQLTLLKTLFVIGTLAGVMAQRYEGYHEGGVIKRTILIDGCTGKPVEKSYNKGGLVTDDFTGGGGFEPTTDPTYPPTFDDGPTYPTEYDGPHDDIFTYNEGYPAVDELVDDYNYLGGGDIDDNELII